MSDVAYFLSISFRRRTWLNCDHYSASLVMIERTERAKNLLIYAQKEIDHLIDRFDLLTKYSTEVKRLKLVQQYVRSAEKELDKALGLIPT